MKGLSQLGLLTAFIPYGEVGRVIRVNFGRIVPWFVMGTLGEGIGLFYGSPKEEIIATSSLYLWL